MTTLFLFFMKPIYLVFLGLLSVLFSVFAQAEAGQLRCKAIGISDGDTFKCLQGKTAFPVRLLYIDAPESAQPYGNKAKQALAKLVFKKQVTLTTGGHDRYGRMLAVVFDEKNQNINLTLVRMGMAWTYSETQPIYTQAMAHAQRQKIGLWQDKQPIHPTDWRKRHRVEKRADASALQNIPPNRPLAAEINCQVKRHCRDMKDYTMAARYFKQCGWQELDGNGDGIPCNQLYREAMQNQ